MRIDLETCISRCLLCVLSDTQGRARHAVASGPSFLPFRSLFHDFTTKGGSTFVESSKIFIFRRTQKTQEECNDVHDVLLVFLGLAVHSGQKHAGQTGGQALEVTPHRLHWE